MSSITPPSGTGSPSAPPPSAPSSPTPAAPPPSTLDTISTTSSGAILFPATGSSAPGLTPPQPLSLMQYSNLIGISRINLQSQNSYSEELGFTVTEDVWKNSVANAQMVRDFYNSVAKAQRNQSNLAAQQQTQSDNTTPAIDTYNATNDFAGDQAATNTMNQAITDFNNGVITEAQFNSAVDIYNAYADAHNLQTYVTDYNTQADIYNSEVDDFNATVDETNALNATTGLPPLPYETPLPSGDLPAMSQSPPATIPITLLPNPPNPIPSVSPQIVAEPFNTLLADSGFADFRKTVNDGTITIDDKLFAAEAYRNKNMFIGKDFLNIQNSPTASSSFIDKDDEGSSPAPSGQAAASSSGYSSLSSGLDNNSVVKVLGQNIFAAATQEAQIPVYLSDFLALTNIAIGQKAGLLSAAPAVLAIGDSSLGGVNSASVSVLLALGFTNIIRGLSTSQQLNGLISDQLAAVGMTAEDLANVTKDITAGVHLSLLQQAILQVANSLGLPGAVAQVLGGTAGIPNLDSVLGSAANPTVNDVLQSSYQTSRLKQNLINQLTVNNPEISNQQAARIINDAIDSAAAKSDYASTDAFNQSLKEELVNQGLNESAAQDSADQASALVDSEVSSDYLDQVVTEESVAQSVQYSDLVKQDTLRSSQTARDLRDSALMQQTQQGVAFREALKQSDAYAAQLTGNTIAQEYTAQTIKEGLLKKSIADNLALLGGDPSIAGAVADTALYEGRRAARDVRDAIYVQLTTRGIATADAHAIADKALLIRRDADAFGSVGGGGSAVSAEEIAAKIRSRAYEILSESFDSPTARSVAQQLASAVVGTPSNQEIAYDQRKNPVSLLNLVNQQVAALRGKNEDKVLEAVRDSFRETMRPTDDLSYIVDKQNTPGTELINAMSLMNAGHGKHPTNFLQSIDIPA